MASSDSGPSASVGDSAKRSGELAAASGKPARTEGPVLRNVARTLTPLETMLASLEPGSLARKLWAEPYCFDFFQAVRLLERMEPKRHSVGRLGPPRREIVRFRPHLSISFPPSTLYDLQPGIDGGPPTLICAFFGLQGPSGILPQHYTELMMRLNRQSKHPEKDALRDFLDLFNHRLISLFYRAWEKYRFFIPYERGEYALDQPDTFTRAVLSLAGLGTGGLRNRLRVSVWEPQEHQPQHKRDLAVVDDLVLVYYAGILSHRPRCAASLEGMLVDYFQLPLHIRQFQGQWLKLEEENQTQVGTVNSVLGTSVVMGSRVWDVQSKFRVQIGPLSYTDFTEFLPDLTPKPDRKAFFTLCHLVRLYVSPELDFDVQLLLKAEEVPEIQLNVDQGLGPRLGWNTWLRTVPMARPATEAIFDSQVVTWIGPPPPPPVDEE